MKIKALLLALFVAGLVVSMAVAAPPPGKGNGRDKHGRGGALVGSTGSSTGTSTGTTTTTGKKVMLCHKTGSKSHPYVLIRVSRNAVPAHMRHGDLPATAAGCPKAGDTGGTTSTGTTTVMTTGTTP
jgi:hypothetical protein